jgi:hypothetical protein
VAVWMDGWVGFWWPSLYYRCDLEAFLGSRLVWSSDQAPPRLLVAKHAVLNDTAFRVYIDCQGLAVRACMQAALASSCKHPHLYVP